MEALGKVVTAIYFLIVTSVEITLTSMPEYFTLVADRPFFFAIRDNETGTIVFMGTVVDPS